MSDGSPIERGIGAAAIGIAAAVTIGPVDSTTARSTAFSSSRTLPGQSYSLSAASAAGSMPVTLRPVRCACFCTK